MAFAEPALKLLFSDFFQIDPSILTRYGALNVSLVADLPLFIDPFLLFNSRRPKYRRLHDQIIRYLRFLKGRAEDQSLDEGLLRAWFTFPEVSQMWLGFTRGGNRGHGLSVEFARALHKNLGAIFHDFGRERLTKGSHLEKLCLIEPGVGRDKISDFTANLIKSFLLEYTQSFARAHIERGFRGSFAVEKVRFNYSTATWQPRTFTLPRFGNDYVLLVPKNILGKDDAWINRADLYRGFESIPDAVPNGELRAQINDYLLRVLPREASVEARKAAIAKTIEKFPVIFDAYIRQKERDGHRALILSRRKVSYSERLFIRQAKRLVHLLNDETTFYELSGGTLEEARRKLLFLKDVIENKGGHRLFYVDGEPIEREEDIQVMYRLTWHATWSDVTREANDGRGPADFKISRGSQDKSIVEFKLASNRSLARNLRKQTPIYQKASDAPNSITAIVYFTKEELKRVRKILRRLKLTDSLDIVLIDARADNKPSGSKAA